MSNVASLLQQRLPRAHVALLRRVARSCASQGAVPYLVGGRVRDLLLQVRAPVPDIDIAINGGTEQTLLALAQDLRAEVTARSRFGTARLAAGGLSVDVSLARSERYAHPGALPTVAPGTLQDDLARRDFTINAMAVCLAKDGPWGELIDLSDGRGDLERRLVRALHARSFADDPTRILRAVRYAGRLGFGLADETRRLIERDLGHVDALSGDRVRHELERIFREEAASTILALARDLGMLAAVHPELGAEHAVLSLLGQSEAAPAVGRDLLYICGLTYQASDRGRQAITARLNMDARWARAVRDVGRLKLALDGLASAALRPRQVHETLRGFDIASVEVAALLAAEPAARAHLRRYLDDLRHVRPMLTGDDLLRMGVPEGPLVGKLLDELLAGRLDGLLATREDEEGLVNGALERGPR